MYIFMYMYREGEIGDIARRIQSWLRLSGLGIPKKRASHGNGSSMRALSQSKGPGRCPYHRVSRAGCELQLVRIHGHCRKGNGSK